MRLSRQILCAFTIFILYSCFGGGGSSFEFNSAKTYARIDKDLKEAEKWGLQALSIEPNNALIPYFLATEVYKPMKKQNKVAKMYVEALKRTEGLTLDRPFRVGEEYINNVHDAIRHEALNIYNQATDLYSKGKFTKAAPKFELSMALNPKIMQNYIALADISYENGDIDKAMEYLDKGAAISTNNDLKIRKAKYARDKKDYELSLSVLNEIQTDEEELQIMIDREVFLIYLEQADYATAANLGSILIEKMFNSLGVDDLVLAEICYNVAISNRELGSQLYNQILETINSGTEDKDVIAQAIENASAASDYFKIAKERFYDASSFNPDDTSSVSYAKETNSYIKQIKELFLPSLKESLNK